MSISSELEKAVSDAVEEMGQPATVAKRLVAWLKKSSEGEIPKEDESRYLSSLRDALDTSKKTDGVTP